MAPLGIGGCGSTATADTAARPATPVVATTPGDPSDMVGVPVDGRTTFADLAYDHTGRLLALGEDKVREVQADGTLRVVRVPHLSGVEPLSLAPGGSVLIVHGYGKRGSEFVEGRRLRTGKRLWRAAIPTSTYGSAIPHWSADARTLLVETERGHAVIDASTGRRLGKLSNGSLYLGRQPLSPTGRRVAASVHHGVALTTVANGKARTIDTGFTVDMPSWSPDGTTIAGAERGLALVDVHTGKVRDLVATGASLQSVTWSPNGRYVAAYALDTAIEDDEHPAYEIIVFDVRTGTTAVVGRFRDGPEFEPLAWSPDSRAVAFQRSDGSP